MSEYPAARRVAARYASRCAADVSESPEDSGGFSIRDFLDWLLRQPGITKPQVRGHDRDFQMSWKDMTLGVMSSGKRLIISLYEKVGQGLEFVTSRTLDLDTPYKTMAVLVDWLLSGARASQPYRSLGRNVPLVASTRVASRYTQLKMAAVTGDRTSVGLFIPVPEDLASQFPKKERDTSPAHITFLYIGEVPADREPALVEALNSAFARLEGPVRAAFDGYDRFLNQDAKVVFSRIRFSHDMSLIRDQVRADLEEAGFEVGDSFPRYNPHTTIQYLNHDEDWTGEAPTGSWLFDSIEVWGLPSKKTINFSPATPLTPSPDPQVGARRMARLMEKRAEAALIRHRWG